MNMDFNKKLFEIKEKDGEVILVKFIGDEDITDVVIPDGVTIIGAYAFSGCSDLINVTIPDGVTKICDSAFKDCSGLINVIIPDSVTTIGGWAFKGCSGLTRVAIGNSVITIGNHAFYFCYGLINVTIPDSVTYIGWNAFGGCDGLTGITIPDSVTTIGDGAFDYCGSLKRATIGNSVTIIGSDAFRGCSDLTEVYITDLAAWCNITFKTEKANPLYYAQDMYLKGELVTDLVIPQGVTEIKEYSFYDGRDFTSVTIPNSVTTIGHSAFGYCTGLTKINWNAKAVADLEYYSNVFYNAGTLGDGITVTFGDSVEKIPEWLFYVLKSSDRPKVKRVTIGNSVTTIGSLAFYGCSDLTDVYIPDSVTSIGYHAFRDCPVESKFEY